jgi:hypothetical protein
MLGECGKRVFEVPRFQSFEGRSQHSATSQEILFL